MSRIGKMPISLPKEVEVSMDAMQILVKGPLGALTLPLNHLVAMLHDHDILRFEARNNSRAAKAMFGTMRASVNNMVHGVTKGFEKRLLLVGVGFRAQVQDNKLTLLLGFSNPDVYEMPPGIQCETPSQTEIVIKGIDCQLVGQVAAEIRAYRRPESYKGKGVRYIDEKVVLKETKKK